MIHDSVSVLKKKFDLCSKSKPETLKAILAIFGISGNCAVKKNSVFCYNPKKPFFTVSQSFVRMMNIVFQAKRVESKVFLNITHDTGNSCFEADFKTVRN